MSSFFLVTRIEFCDTLDRVLGLKQTFSFPVRWFKVLDIIEDVEEEEEDEEEDEVKVFYEIEDGEIYESNKTKNRLAAENFLASL